MQTESKDLIMQNRVFGWIALGTGLVLSIPLIAMQFTAEVNWQLNDFIIMGILLFGMGSLFIGVARVVPRNYRVLTAIACSIILLLIWIHLAVGIVDTWPFAGS